MIRIEDLASACEGISGKLAYLQDMEVQEQKQKGSQKQKRRNH